MKDEEFRCALEQRREDFPDSGCDTESTSANRFKVLTTEELEHLPTPRWRVANVLPERGLGVLWGAPGSGKTSLALDLAAAVARGRPWFGHEVRKCGVVYVATEGNMQVRVGAYRTHYDVSSSELRGLGILQSPVDLLGDQDFSDLFRAIQQFVEERGEVGVVIIDTLNRSMPGGNENNPEDMGTMAQKARLLEVRFSCLSLFVHHSGKDESRGSRGHSSLRAAADVELRVMNCGSHRQIKLEKSRDSATGATVGEFSLVPVPLHDLQPPTQGAIMDACVVVPEGSVDDALARMTKPARILYKHIRDLRSEHRQIEPVPEELAQTDDGLKAADFVCTRKQLKTYVESHEGLGTAKTTSGQHKAFDRALKRLETLGKIAIKSDWISLVDKMDKTRNEGIVR